MKLRHAPPLLAGTALVALAALGVSGSATASAAATSAGAQAPDVRVEVRVTSAVGTVVYVDRGAADGLAEGDRVTWRLDANAAATGVVRSVSANGARVELDPGSPLPPVGARGEILVPAERKPKQRVPPGATGQQPDAPAGHPPWTHPPETWASDRPLLAPAFGLAPEEREPRLHGRAWLRFDRTSDTENDRTSTLGALGADATLENPFGDGGALRVDAEVFLRASDVEDGPYEYDESRFRLDRLAYDVGGTPERPTRWTLGRFVQVGFPELGVLDGVEWSHGSVGRDRFGVSAGWMPDPQDDLASFEDLQAALWWRHAFDREERASIGAAFQKTLHDGEADRDLFLVQAEARPGESFSVRASTWIDLYTSDDEVKGSGVELTEAQLSATWRPTVGSGVTLFGMHRVYPELLREEYLDLTPEKLTDGRLDRAGVSGWTALGARTRLTGRFDLWSDEEDDGTTGELGVSFAELLGRDSDVSLAAQYADGSFSSGPGARIQGSKLLGDTRFGLGWQSFWYAQKDFGGADDEIAQHTLFGTVDWHLSERWDLSVLADRSIGDDVDAWTLGLLLQTRF